MLLLVGLLVHAGLLMSWHVVYSVPLWGVADVVMLVKNVVLMLGVDVMTRKRQSLHRGPPSARPPPSLGTVVVNDVKYSVLEAMTYRVAIYLGLLDRGAPTAAPTTPWGWAAALVGFVAVTFVYEVVFDFGHYWTHRWLHMSPVLYRAFHAAHHRHADPTVYDAYDDTVGGTVLTNNVPHILALGAVALLRGGAPLPHFCHALLLVYKSEVEIAGHLSKDMGNVSTFPQCMALPARLGIALFTQDHYAHHRNGKTNFAKRFSLWDKCFGTFQTSS